MSETSITQIICGNGPVCSGRFTLDTKELVGIKIKHQLGTKDVVAIDPQIVDKVGRFCDIRREHRPVEEGNSSEVNEIITAGRS